MNTKQSKHSLIFVTIELTLRCNLRCLHCGATAGSARPGELTKGEWIDVMAQLADLGCEEVCLLGGEPMLFEGWEDVARAVEILGMRLVFITNGWRIDDGAVDKLKRITVLDRIGVSLDGATAETHDALRGRAGSFDRAQKALFALRDAGIEAGAITSVSKRNLGDLFALRDLLLNQNITWQLQGVAAHGNRWNSQWNLTPSHYYQIAEFIAESRAKYGVDAMPISGSHCFGYHSTRLDGYAETAKWPGCAGGMAAVGITSSGEVKPCLSLPDRYVIGNLKKESLAEIWGDDSRFERTRGFHRDQLTGFCQRCEHADSCKGGCPNLPIALNGSDGDNPFCLYRMESEGQVPPNPTVQGFFNE